MKKETLCLAGVLVFLVVTAASAQVSIGVKGGLNLANVSFDVPNLGVNPTIRTGATVGGFIGLSLSRAIVIQPEVLVAMKGTTATLADIPSAEEAIKMTYLDVPVLFRVNIPTTSRVSPFLYGGPNFAFPLSANEVITAQSGMIDQHDFKNQLKGADAGIAVGGGVQFGKLSIEARFTQGITNILTEQASDNGTASVKNRAFAILGGLTFK